MSDKRESYLTANAPFLNNSTVVLYRDTFDYHISSDRKHAEIEKNVITCLEKPSKIVRGTTNPSYVIFIDENQTTAGSGAIFGVVVDPNGTPNPVVASFSYRNGFLKASKYTVLWPSLEKSENE